MFVETKIEKLTSSSKKGPDVFYPIKKLPYFKFSNYVVKNGKKHKAYNKGLKPLSWDPKRISNRYADSFLSDV